MRRFFALLSVFVMFFTSVFAFYDLEDDSESASISEYLEVSGTVQSKPVIQASAAILYDRTCKRVLFEKNADKQVPNASTTKILTAIVAFENGHMDDVVTISKAAANTGGSKVKFRTGDKITLNDLMIGMLLRSGNDAAVAIAEHIGGSVEGFCDMLNEKAEEIGAKNTHFTSPHGLDDEEHYSTAYDLALLADYALNIPYIANIVARKTATIKINDYTRDLGNTNEMLSYYSGADGVKTGFTGDAGRCLVTSATRDGWQLISVVLGCNTKKQRTLESTALLNYGFQNFSLVNLCENMQKEFKIVADKAKAPYYVVRTEAEFTYPICEEEKEKIHYAYHFVEGLEAPVSAGEKIGEIEISVGENVVGRFEVKTNENIERKDLWAYFWEILQMLPQKF
ncbi:MAG: D-alanyl-D-alanine carboxypeptidase [Clostridia bacterium]|nr:D-alanyl-D-alanine carboxypeptidase [Clostridia bacterium]